LIEIDRANHRAILQSSGENMKITVAMVALLAAWQFTSAKKYQMTSAVGVPAATEIVKVQKAKDNGNMKLDIKVGHPARPASLIPPANSYLVWIHPKWRRGIQTGGDRGRQESAWRIEIGDGLEGFRCVHYRRTERQGDRPIERRGLERPRKYEMNCLSDFEHALRLAL
jgi:hypothetical protein